MDPDTHNIVVTSDAITAEQISNVIASLDVPKPQVLIKVVFVEVDLNNDSDIGVEGGMVNNSGGLSQSAGNVLGLSGLNSVVTNFNALGQPMSFRAVAGFFAGEQWRILSNCRLGFSGHRESRGVVG